MSIKSKIKYRNRCFPLESHSNKVLTVMEIRKKNLASIYYILFIFTVFTLGISSALAFVTPIAITKVVLSKI